MAEFRTPEVSHWAVWCHILTPDVSHWAVWCHILKPEVSHWAMWCHILTPRRLTLGSVVPQPDAQGPAVVRQIQRSALTALTRPNPRDVSEPTHPSPSY